MLNKGRGGAPGVLNFPKCVCLALKRAFFLGRKLREKILNLPRSEGGGVTGIGQSPKDIILLYVFSSLILYKYEKQPKQDQNGLDRSAS